jgi:2'-5' RNA ligase
MVEPLVLTGADAASPPTDRLFFAILPDAHAAARIAGLAQRLRAENGLRGRAIATERLHVTLIFLGDHVGVPQQIVALAAEAAAGVAMPPFDVELDRVASFPRRKNLPLVLLGSDGVAGLTAFRESLAAALKAVGLGHDRRPGYTPHLTLLRDDRCVAEQAIEPIGWTAGEFVLVRSLLGRSRHIPLARWPLRG